MRARRVHAAAGHGGPASPVWPGQCRALGNQERLPAVPAMARANQSGAQWVLHTARLPSTRLLSPPSCGGSLC